MFLSLVIYMCHDDLELLIFIWNDFEYTLDDTDRVCHEIIVPQKMVRGPFFAIKMVRELENGQV